MTKQEYYDLLVASAHNGTFPSYSKGQCFYRLNKRPDDRRRCAVGLLIPDDKYDEYLETKSVEASEVISRLAFPDGLTVDDLREIQEVHDHLASEVLWAPKHFEEMLTDLLCFKDIKRAV